MDGLRLKPAETAPELREECGVFAVVGHPDAVRLTYYGLYALQHRGQESAGIAVARPGGEIHHHRAMGLVSEVFDDETLQRLAGLAPGPSLALGHVRYSTTGASRLENAQPLVMRCRGDQLALAHNGNLVDAAAWRRRLEAEGAIFQTTTDTEIIAHLAARRAGTWAEALAGAVAQVHGGYALGALTPGGLFAARDPHGIRPLMLGRLDDAHVLASETCAFDTVGATPLREVEPGEWLWIDQQGLRSGRLAEPRRQAFCVFEFIYFARPDSVFRGRPVHEVRKRLGRLLAREAPVDADVVIGVPDSSLPAAAGYGEASGIPVELGLIKNRYVGRTFIRPGAASRAEAVRIKLNPIRGVVAGRRVILVDDSLVRGTTSRRLVQALRDAGALEVHLRITSPPYRFSCHYGVDTADRSQLIASQHDTEEIRRMVGADSLHFLSSEAMLAATGLEADSFCLGCFSGRYPVPPEDPPGSEPVLRGAAAGPVAAREGDLG
ncbi:MAG TPA: amidophosphoribosyltransferase [Bacillota bacterium]